LLILQITLGVIVLLLLILLLPVHLHVFYHEKLVIRAGVLFINFTLYPRPPISEKRKQKKAKKEKRKQAKEKEELSRAEEMLRSEGVLAVVHYYIEMTRLIGTALKRLVRTITVDKLILNLIVASDDASDTAVNYGRVCSVIYPAQALIESIVRVKKRDINIKPDFLLEKGNVNGEIRLHVLPVRVLWALLMFFIGYIGNTTSTKTVQ